MHDESINDGKWKLHIYPFIDHKLLFKLEVDPREMHKLAELPEYQDEIKRLTALMEDWRVEIGDSDSLCVRHPESKEVDYSQYKRVFASSYFIGDQMSILEMPKF